MWIELHQTLPTHRKTLEAADLLNMKPVHLTGHLVTFWLWALDNAPEGSVKASPRTLAYAAQWDGDAQLFVDALVAAGFMDREGDGYTIHDWREYAGRLLDKRKQDADRKRRERDAARASSLNSGHVNGTSNGHPTDDPRMSERTVPNRTVPNQDQDHAPAARPASAAVAASPTKSKQAAHLSVVPVPKPNRLGEIIDLCRAEGVALHHDGQDTAAVKRASASPRLIAEAYIAAARGEWRPNSDDWLRDNLSLTAVIKRLGGYEAWKQGRAAPVAERRANARAYSNIVQ